MNDQKLNRKDGDPIAGQPSVSYEEGLKQLEQLFTSVPPEQPAVLEGKVISNVGQVASITLPANWEEGPVHERLLGHSHYQPFNPPNEREVKIFLLYRGVRIALPTAMAFHELLDIEAHTLIQDEVARITALLPADGNEQAFQLSCARTEDLNGKRVLVISGRYPEDDKDMVAVLVDADGTGSVVQEIEYQAPSNKYKQYLPQSEQVFASICWK